MTDFIYQVEQFADLRILRYRIPGFEKLPLNKKRYIYYLSEAALCGRDIIWDQNNEQNLWVRKCLSILCVTVDESDKEYPLLERYYKRVLFSNGIHHHYSTEKIRPEFTQQSLQKWLGQFSYDEIKTLKAANADDLFHSLSSILFDDDKYSKRVCQDEGQDLVTNSANNYYYLLTQAEAEVYYDSIIDKSNPEPISYGLNSRLVKTSDGIKNEVYCLADRYSKSIAQIIYWLEKAANACENSVQKQLISTLCKYYKTGDLKLFDKYSIEWLNEKEGVVDFINGFIEVYGDSLGYKGAWESMVNIIDREETDKASVISENALWFEQHSPVMSQHKKDKVDGVSMKVINAVMLGGDCYPASPLGINLPNAEWIREKHGSKSVSLQNISKSYEMASLTSGVIEEFAYSSEEVDLHKKYGALADNLHTHLHECVGHGSGKLEEGVRSDELKAYSSVIEEARADLFGLYFMGDNKMLELELVPHMDVCKAQYNSYIRNGLMVQLARISQGNNIEQTHMRNRQLVSSWVFSKGQHDKVIEKLTANGNTYFVINDYQKLRVLFGELLKEIQRIKSQGDYEAAKVLVEQYGVNVNKEIHDEVLERYAKLEIAPYSGFLNPQLTPVFNADEQIIDIVISYNEGFIEQMNRYNSDYSFEIV